MLERPFWSTFDITHDLLDTNGGLYYTQHLKQWYIHSATADLLVGSKVSKIIHHSIISFFKLNVPNKIHMGFQDMRFLFKRLFICDL